MLLLFLKHLLVQVSKSTETVIMGENLNFVVLPLTYLMFMSFLKSFVLHMGVIFSLELWISWN